MLFRQNYFQTKFRFVPRYMSLRTFDSPQVTISQGKLRGSVSTDLDGKLYCRFQGIPYAQPPVGNLRFKAPVALDSWSGILDATREANCCYSRHPFQSEKVQGSEDCLYLNVYSKNLSGETPKPVMFWIHGGGFIFGSGGTEFYGPDFLITEDVIIVTVNYRLGILGFISFEDPDVEVPGNAGLKDIVMALKWVKNNIEKFGGDPNNVTIFGQSAGGTAVHLLMLSQMSKGLFHKAMSMSGCALIPFNVGVKGMEKITPLINENGSEKDIYKRLMTMSVEDLYKIQKKIDSTQTYVPSLQRPFGIVVESPNERAFLTEEPLNIISQGNFEHVPFIIGHTSAETLCSTLLRKRYWPGFETCEDLIPSACGYKIGSQESRAIARELRKFYLGNDQIKVAYKDRILMESDLIFIHGTYLTVMNQFQKSRAPTYLYRMSINSRLNLIKKFCKINDPGFAHGDDLNYLFKNVSTPKLSPGGKEDLAVRRLVKLWTNFAKYGNPTPHKEDSLLPIIWKPVTNAEMDYLEFGEKLIVASNPEELRRVHFLESLLNDNPSKMKCRL